MKKLYGWLAGLQIFVGIGAIAGGSAGMLNPQAPFGMSVEVLKNSPFNSFFIPGVILFTIIGLGSIISALSILFKFRYRAYVCNVFSWALVIWIIVQVIILRGIHPLHIIYFAIGAIEALLAIIALFREQFFPANLVMDLTKRNGKGM